MYISIDIGGTTTRSAALPFLENITNFSKIEFKNTHQFNSDFSSLIDSIQKLSSENVTAIGIGTAGELDQTKSMIIHSQNVPGYQGKPLKQMLSDIFHCPIYMDNDAIVAALGEAFYGSGVKSDFEYVIWGTGIGGAHAKHYQNHVQVNLHDWHMNFLDWEKNCGGKKITQQFGKPAEDLNDSEWEIVMTKFSKELKNFIKTTNPSLIIFGGGIANKQSKRLLALQEKISVEIKISDLGEDTGLYGGFALLKNQLY